MSTKKLELSQPVAIVIAGVMVAAAIVFTSYIHPPQNQGAQAAQQLPANVNVRAPSASDHIIGSPSAPIVLIEYTDFQCPYCQMIYPTLKRIVDESQGKIAWVIRNFPLYQIHPQAEPAANAAECIAEQAGNTGFWKFADTVFTDQSKLGPDYYAQIAKGLGVNMTQYNSCVTSKKFQSKIDADLQEAESNGGQGKPYTVVYGHGVQVPVSGALPYAQIMSVIKSVQAK